MHANVCVCGLVGGWVCVVCARALCARACVHACACVRAFSEKNMRRPFSWRLRPHTAPGECICKCRKWGGASDPLGSGDGGSPWEPGGGGGGVSHSPLHNQIIRPSSARGAGVVSRKQLPVFVEGGGLLNLHTGRPRSEGQGGLKF